MKTTLTACFILLLFIACKNEKPLPTSIEKEKVEVESIQHTDQKIEDTIPIFSEENLKLKKEKTKAIKRKRLITAQDDKSQLQKLVVSKNFIKEEDRYILDYQYPYLNENIDPAYAVFNNFIKENYLDIKKTESEILEGQKPFCDTLKVNRLKDKRIIDYKIYTAKNDLISVVLYKENYYSGMLHSTYLFDCLNFDLNKHKFIGFGEYFETGSEEEIFTTINAIIEKDINSGELYYDCWGISKDDFNTYKDNFVVTDDMVEFYFDDCIICPSYTGTYSIEIPIKDIMHLIKKYNNLPKIS
ncbi:RsiV family protein [Aquimarina sediminis]|uniref:RsiV family protein n=1 Tax=Aquimarina sediminis TaxID=2070536 RepID=UPI000CA00A16|nr:RsiV family protein [Aquimarina sediminis]